MNNEIIKINGKNKEQELILKFLQEEKDEFHISIDKIVNLEEYAEKITKKAIAYAYYDNDKIIGLLVMYANDKKNYTAHVSFLCVKREYRGKHLATNLMKKAIETAKMNDMKYIELYTDNPIAQKLYEGLGYYKIPSDKEGKIHYRKDLI